MDNDSLIEAVRTESGALSAALAVGPLTAAVPTCEDWTVADLASHVGSFCGFWSHVLCEGTGRPLTPFSDPPAGDDLAPWCSELAAHLVTELAATPSSTEVWTWFDADHTAGFVARRCAHELAVHRYDAQSARGTCAPIAADLATDGIDEMLDALTTVRERSGEGTGRTLLFDCADRSAGWSLTFQSDRLHVRRPRPGGDLAPEADLVLTGTASDLELLAYHRPPLGTVDFRGDGSVLDEWYREFSF